MLVKKLMGWPGPRKAVQYLFFVCSAILIRLHVEEYAPTGAIKEENGSLKVDEESCILCRLCMIACPIGIMVIDDEKKSVQKCTLCIDADNIIPACVDACKDNVLKIFSIEDLDDLKSDSEFTDVLEEALKIYKSKI